MTGQNQSLIPGGATAVSALSRFQDMSRFHGAAIATVSYSAAGTAYATGANGKLVGGPITIDGDGYDNCIFDTDGYSALGAIVPIDWFAAPDNYVGYDGILRIPDGLAGYYRITQQVVPTAAIANTTFMQITGAPSVNGSNIDWDVTGLGEGLGNTVPSDPMGGASAPYPPLGSALSVWSKPFYLNVGDEVQAALTDLYFNEGVTAGSIYAYLALEFLGS